MSDSFGQSAARLSGLAARALGWRPAEFWNATPADLALCLREPEQAAASLNRQELNLLLERERDG